ncbi:N-6 DNA methylase [Alcanivorax sp. ZXX171]|nr:N-6 DNA methylase [Alcanivorax sp. ZXX171]
MITGELKSKVDKIWDTMWSGGVSNPLSVIEQLTYLLFIKRLDEIHTREENKAQRFKKPIENPVFGSGQDHLRWSRFKDFAPEDMFNTVRDQVFPFIKTLGNKGEEDGEGGSTYTHHMKDALFMMPNPRVLANVVDQLDSIDMNDADTKGDLYEYMLGKIASAGQNGQFRTPRHIIKLMVDMTAPTPKDVICDPACGTAGFLVAASEYLQRHHGDAIYKNDEARRRFNEGTFHGYDFDNTMLRIGSMNMLLHGVGNPDIRYKDSLSGSDEDEKCADGFSLILANPPFSGSLDYESASKDLLRDVKTKKTELLFVSLFKKILRSGGRAAVVVPAGVLESDSKAHESIRKILVDEMNLEAVIKLPHWVFKPYASVDTSILFFSKGGETDSVWFYRMENDGYSDGATRTPIVGSEIPEVMKLWRNEDLRLAEDRPRKHRVVSVDEIRKNGYDLCPPFYLSGHEYPKNADLVRLGELFHIKKGRAAAASASEEGLYPFITSSLEWRKSDSYSFDSEAICIPTVSSTGHGHASINTIHYVKGRFQSASITAVLTPKKKGFSVERVYYYLLAHKDDLLVPLMRGATNKSLNIDRLPDLLVPIIEDGSKEEKIISEIIRNKSRIDEAKKIVRQLVNESEGFVSQLRQA